MANLKTTASTQEKDRLRAEIDGQIAEFLRRGGKIDVVTSEQQRDHVVGSAWHLQDDMANLVS